jgi:hypothetical protein
MLLGIMKLFHLTSCFLAYENSLFASYPILHPYFCVSCPLEASVFYLDLRKGIPRTGLVEGLKQ